MGRREEQQEGGRDKMMYVKKIQGSLRMLTMLFLPVFLLSALVLADGQTAFAAEEEPEYTYTVRLFAGNEDVGRLTGRGVQVQTPGSSASISYEENQVVVTGLQYDDVVYISAGDAAKEIDSRYYVKGVKIAGRDVDEEGYATGTFPVDGDRDFVIGYGVSGDMAAYTVNYVDAAGNALLDSDTYYGNIGERQYVSARYVDGYVPQAYNLVKTLSANEAENVFEFQYTPGTAPAAPGEGTAAATPAAPGAAAAPAAPAAPAEAGETTVTPEGGEVVPVEDENVPQDLVDLDEENTPLANKKLDDERPGTQMSYLPIYIGIGAAAVAALAISAIYLKRRRKGAVTTEKLLEEIQEDFSDDK